MKKKFLLVLTLLTLCLFCMIFVACKKCNHAQVREEIVTEADCETAGLIKVVCEKCGETVENKTVDALMHDYGDWSISSNPTIYVNGEMQRVCTRNNLHIEKQTVPKLSKQGSYTANVTRQPTCTSKGTITYSSAVYGSFDAEIPANLHTYNEDKDGYCAVCDTKYYTAGLNYTLSNDGSYYIIGKQTVSSGNIIIPHTYKNLPVKEIASEAFLDKKITGITIPEYVENIGAGAFNGSSITRVNFNAINCADFNAKNWIFLVNTSVQLTIGCRVERIPARMFYPLLTQDRTVKLTKITFEENSALKTIGESAFLKTNVSQTLVLPDSLETIGESAFYNTDISALIIGDSVTSIGKSAFGACEKLISVKFGKCVTEICDDAFNYCVKLDKIDLSGTVAESIGDDAFKGCTSVSEINLPDTLRKIGKQAFIGCSSLETLDLGRGLQIIEEQAFAACGITSLTVPSSVVSVGNSAFEECENLTDINFNAENCADFNSGNRVFANTAKGAHLTVTFGDTVKRIPARIFYSTSNATELPLIGSLTLGKNIQSVGDYAFFGVTVNESVYLGSSWQQVTVGNGNTALSSIK